MLSLENLSCRSSCAEKKTKTAFQFFSAGFAISQRLNINSSVSSYNLAPSTSLEVWGPMMESHFFHVYLPGPSRMVKRKRDLNKIIVIGLPEGADNEGLIIGFMCFFNHLTIYWLVSFLIPTALEAMFSDLGRIYSAHVVGVWLSFFIFKPICSPHPLF